MGHEAISRIADLGHKHVVIVGTSDVAYVGWFELFDSLSRCCDEIWLDLGVKTDFVARLVMEWRTCG